MEHSLPKDLWLLLLEKPTSLTDEQIELLLASEKQIGDAAHSVWSRFPEEWKRVKRYRARKQELAVLPIKELQERLSEICERRGRIMAADYGDDLPDSFFESPRIDEDEHIIRELLEEKRVLA